MLEAEKPEGVQDDGRIMHVLRNQAWERARAELYSVQVTFFGDEEEKGKQFKAAVKAFIDDVEMKYL